VKAWGPDATLLDTLANEPGAPLRLAITVVNGGETLRRCLAFEPSTCRLRAAGRRTKLSCREPVPDAACGAVPPECGNGVREPGERCDGVPECTETCSLPALAAGSCCQGDGICEDTPAFSLAFYVYQHCTGLGYPDYVAGGACDGATGSCFVPTLPTPLILCCETGGDCFDAGTPITDNAGLWYFYNGCSAGGYGTVYEASCESDEGLCVRW
jgi:hypothetical protein